MSTLQIEYQTITTSIFDLDNLEQKVKALNVKAKRLGARPIVYTVGGKTTARYPGRHWYDPEITLTLHDITITYPYFKIDGWTMVGTIDHHERLVHEIKGSIPAHYRYSEPSCDHCHTKRDRNTTVILTDNQGNYKQIGKSCLALYTGLDMADCALMSDFSVIDGILKGEELTDDEMERLELMEKYGKSELGLTSFLGFVALSIREYGWVSSSDAYSSYKQSSADHALDLMAASKDKGALVPTDADRQLALDVIAWARAITDNESSYMLNLKAIAENEFYTPKTSGYAASMINAYNKAQKTKADAEAQTSVYLGVVGGKITVDCECYFVSDGILTSYGWLHINSFRDAQGNVIVWKSNTACQKGKYKLTATVKAQEEYKGIKQTVVTRAKLTELS